MIEIITEHVDMPESNKRRFQYNSIDPNGKKWIVTDNQYDKIIFKGKYENAALISHNLNKKFYK